MKKTVAIVEDEIDIRTLIAHHLQKANFETIEFSDSEQFFSYMEEKKNPDLIILDLMLPDADGFEICKQLKSDKVHSRIPIVILTAKGEETDKVLGLELGADDYVTKPFSPRELIARIKAVLRRTQIVENEDVINIGGILKLDLQKYEVVVNGKKKELTSTEFKILKTLSMRKGWVFSREQILESLWGDDKIVTDRTVDVHIKKLRDKLGIAGELIKNVRGVGYKLEE